MQLEKHTAIITGAGSGLGAETARQLAAAGCKVALLDLDIAAIKLLAKELNGIAIECDVSAAESVQAAIKEVNNQLGAARICINCAGIAPAERIVSREGAMPLANFKKVIDVNLIGTFNVMRLAAEAMINLSPLGEDNERGIIINTASIAAYEGQMGQTAYSASKGGVAAMTLPAARELAQWGIRVVAIAPGLINTPMLQGLPENIRNDLSAEIPFPKRLGMPREYANLVLHIINNSYINGSVIRLDAGLRMS